MGAKSRLFWSKKKVEALEIERAASFSVTTGLACISEAREGGRGANAPTGHKEKSRNIPPKRLSNTSRAVLEGDCALSVGEPQRDEPREKKGRIT